MEKNIYILLYTVLRLVLSFENYIVGKFKYVLYKYSKCLRKMLNFMPYEVMPQHLGHKKNIFEKNG